MDVARLVFGQGCGPSCIKERAFLVGIAHAGAFSDVSEWRPFAQAHAVRVLGCDKGLVAKTLRRLEAGGWINARRAKGRPSLFSINAERLTCTETPIGTYPEKPIGESEGTRPDSRIGTYPGKPIAPIRESSQDLSVNPDTYRRESSSEEERECAPSPEPESASFDQPDWWAPVHALFCEHFAFGRYSYKLESSLLSWIRDGHKILPDNINDRSKLFELELQARVEKEDFGANPQFILTDGVKRWARRKAQPPINAPAIKTDVTAIRRQREATLAAMKASTSNPWRKDDE